MDIYRENCVVEIEFTFVCVCVCVRACISAFMCECIPLSVAHKSHPKKLRRKRRSTPTLIFSFTLYATMEYNLNRIYTLEISLEAYVTRNFTTPNLFSLQSDWCNVRGFHIWPIFYFIFNVFHDIVYKWCLRIKTVLIVILSSQESRNRIDS